MQGHRYNYLNDKQTGCTESDLHNYKFTNDLAVSAQNHLCPVFVLICMHAAVKGNISHTVFLFAYKAMGFFLLLSIWYLSFSKMLVLFTWKHLARKKKNLPFTCSALKGNSGNRLTVAEQHSCCLEPVGIQCLSQGHFIWEDSCHHEGILQSQCGFPIKKTARTDSGSSNDILDSFSLVFSLTVSN